MDADDVACPKCSSSDMRLAGFDKNRAGENVRRFICRNCGKRSNENTVKRILSAVHSEEEIKAVNWREECDHAAGLVNRKHRRTGDPFADIEVEIEPGEDGFGKCLPCGDLHLGGFHDGYDSFKTMVERIIRERWQFWGTGDYVEQFLRPIKGNWLPIYNQVLSPQEQELLFKSVVRELVDEGLLPFLVMGNHDTRAKNLTGIDTWSMFDWGAMKIRTNRATINVTCGKAKYKGLVVHKSLKGSSWFNPTHAGKRELMEEMGDADFVILGHKHTGHSTLANQAGRNIPIIMVGSFNAKNAYSQSMFSKHGFISTPILYFDSEKRVDHPLWTPGFYRDKIITFKIEDMK